MCSHECLHHNNTCTCNYCTHAKHHTHASNTYMQISPPSHPTYTQHTSNTQLRVPKFGRDLSYAPHTAELLVGCSGSDLYRVDLSEGRFNEPLHTSATGVNAVGVAPTHGLVGIAGVLLEWVVWVLLECGGWNGCWSGCGGGFGGWRYALLMYMCSSCCNWFC